MEASWDEEYYCDNDDDDNDNNDILIITKWHTCTQTNGYLKLCKINHVKNYFFGEQPSPSLQIKTWSKIIFSKKENINNT